MIKKTIILILFFNTAIHALAQHKEDIYLTVMATSGLNLRSEANLKSNVVRTLPFGILVKVVDNKRYYEGFKNNIEIDGMNGFWIEVEIEKLKGFIFSAFTLKGDYIVRSKDGVNTDFRILKEGYHCEAINYDPNLNWYALVAKNNQPEFVKVNVKIQLKNIENSTEFMNYGSFYKIEIDIVEESIILIGTKDAIHNLIQPPSKLINFSKINNEIKVGDFLYPYKGIITHGKPNHHFSLEGDIIIEANSENNENPTINYALNYIVNNRPEKEEYITNLMEHLPIKTWAKTHSSYKTPYVIWMGDVNNDEMIDVLLGSNDMKENCGGSYFYHLFVTEDYKISKKAESLMYYCETN